jgi:hypothetical protein
MYNELPGDPDSLPATPFTVSVCNWLMSVNYDPPLHRMLMARLTSEGQPPGAYEFDRWLHGQLLVTDYNKT